MSGLEVDSEAAGSPLYDPDATQGAVAVPTRRARNLLDARPPLYQYALITVVVLLLFVGLQHVFQAIGSQANSAAYGGHDATRDADVAATEYDHVPTTRSGKALVDADKLECPEPEPCPACEAAVADTKANVAPAAAIVNADKCDAGCAKCSETSSCFFGECYCHPGFDGPTCSEKATKVPYPSFGKWWFECPNVKAQKKFDMNDATMDWGVSQVIPGCDLHPQFCQMMCFYSEHSGIMQVPMTMWRGAQNAEQTTWNGNRDTSDRGDEHVVAFGGYDAVPDDLGHMIEVGPGPWSQFRYMISILKGKGRTPNVKSITLMEPGGIGYIKNTPTCAYADGVLRDIGGTPLGYPTVFNFAGVEHLRYRHSFDTLMVMNVVEHVQDAYAFFQNIYHAIRPGGLIIFHERYFQDPNIANGVLGEHLLHPIRLRKVILDKFTSGFEHLYFNDKPTPQMLNRHNQEIGYYFIGRKKKEELQDCCSNRFA